MYKEPSSGVAKEIYNGKLLILANCAKRRLFLMYVFPNNNYMCL